MKILFWLRQVLKLLKKFATNEKKDKNLPLKGELPCMQVGEHQGLVEGDFTEKLQQVLHLLLKNFVR